MYKSLQEFTQDTVSNRRIKTIVVSDYLLVAALTGQIDIAAGIPADAIVKKHEWDERTESYRLDIVHPSFDPVPSGIDLPEIRPHLAIRSSGNLTSLRCAKIICISNEHIVEALQGRGMMDTELPVDTLVKYHHQPHFDCGDHYFIVVHPSFEFIDYGDRFPHFRVHFADTPVTSSKQSFVT